MPYEQEAVRVITVCSDVMTRREGRGSADKGQQLDALKSEGTVPQRLRPRVTHCSEKDGPKVASGLEKVKVQGNSCDRKAKEKERDSSRCVSDVVRKDTSCRIARRRIRKKCDCVRKSNRISL